MGPSGMATVMTEPAVAPAGTVGTAAVEDAGVDASGDGSVTVSTGSVTVLMHVVSRSVPMLLHPSATNLEVRHLGREETYLRGTTAAEESQARLANGPSDA